MNRDILITAAALACFALMGCKSQKGRAVALELDGKTVLAEEKCPKRNYVACGQRVREKAKAILCQRNGAGNHKFLYRISRGKPIKNTARCK